MLTMRTFNLVSLALNTVDHDCTCIMFALCVTVYTNSSTQNVKELLYYRAAVMYHKLIVTFDDLYHKHLIHVELGITYDPVDPVSVLPTC